MASDALNAAVSRLILSDERAHDEILEAAQDALKKSKTDEHAQRTCLVALIKLDRYDEALHLLNTAGSALPSQAPLEHAYVLYKAGQPREALKIAQSHGKTRDFQHMLAQAAYRAEEFELARDIYARLSADGSEEDSDLRVNRGAVDAALCWTGKSAVIGDKKIEREAFEQYDTAFNAGSEAAAKGDLKQALMFLSKARDLCLAADMNDDEKADELATINVQILFVLYRLGRTEEAQSLATQIPTDSTTDPNLKHITQTSLLAVSPHSNPYIAHNLFSTTASGLKSTDRPFSYQSLSLSRNDYAHRFSAHKFNGVADSTLATLKSAEDHSLSELLHAGAYNALAHAQLNAASSIEAAKPLLARLSTLRANRPNDVGLLLATVQLYIHANNYAEATNLLESHISSSSSPAPTALTAVLVALYDAQSRPRPAKEALRKAAEHARASETRDSGLLSAAGTALLHDANASDRETAHAIFSSLPSSKASRAGLLASTPTFAALQASSADFSSLPPITRLTAHLDVDALEAAGVPTLPHPTAAPRPSSKKRAAQVTAPGLNPDGSAKTTKKRRIRARRMPADFVEGKALDPERWLPLRERSGYRPKKGKKKGREGGGAQGATQGGEEAVAPVKGAPVQQAARKKGKGKGKR